MKASIAALAAIAALAMAGCAGHNDPLPGQKARVSQTVMEAFKDSYQPIIGPTNPGAFAVSVSGRNAGYAYCSELVCKSGFAYGQQAMKQCEKYGEPCYLFAVGNDIRVAYEIGD
jgi:hypothetical protein